MFTFNVGGDVTLKANVTSCSSDTTSQLVVTFETVSGGGFWCVYPESAGNPATFSLSPGATKSVACTENAGINGAFAGLPADARVYDNCQSFSTHNGMSVRNLDGTSVFAADSNAGSCTVIATSEQYTVVSGINPNGIPRK